MKTIPADPINYMHIKNDYKNYIKVDFSMRKDILQEFIEDFGNNPLRIEGLSDKVNVRIKKINGDRRLSVLCIGCDRNEC